MIHFRSMWHSYLQREWRRFLTGHRESCPLCGEWITALLHADPTHTTQAHATRCGARAATRMQPMTTTQSNYLDQFTFLTDDQRKAMLTAGYDSIDAFLGTTQEALKEFGIGSGHAATMIHRAKLQAQAATAAAEQAAKDEPIRRHWSSLGGPRHTQAVAALRREGFERAPINADGKVDLAVLDTFIDDGMPDVPWYGECQVVRLEDVGGKRKHHPKTGKLLTRGDVVQWVQLDRDALIVAAAIFETPDVLAGDSERAVLADVQSNGPMSRIMKPRLTRDQALRQRCEARIDGNGVSNASGSTESPDVIRSNTAEKLALLARGDIDSLCFECLYHTKGHASWSVQVEGRVATIYVQLPSRDTRSTIGTDDIIEDTARTQGFDVRRSNYRGSGCNITVRPIRR